MFYIFILNLTIHLSKNLNLFLFTYNVVYYIIYFKYIFIFHILNKTSDQS
jgi:hypothetical protein